MLNVEKCSGTANGSRPAVNISPPKYGSFRSDPEIVQLAVMMTVVQTISAIQYVYSIQYDYVIYILA